MPLQNFFEEALQKGEKIKNQLMDEIIQSSWTDRLLKNEKFINGVVNLLKKKSKIEKNLNQVMSLLLKKFDIATQDEVRGMEKKIHQLETELQNLHRKNLSRKLNQKAATKEAKSPARKKSKS